MIVIALSAALIAPWFINWDDYKANFEVEATRILGQPVHVNGTASASILPSPSLTFTDVAVGDTEGEPMMTVKRFAVTIELMPLIQGEIRVISMKIEEPVVRVAIDDAGRIDWTLRGEASRDLDPEAVSLSGVEISNGTLHYTDARSDASVTLTDVAATVEARSLAGPWRIDGSYRSNGVPSQFTVSTGRRLEDGSIRVKTDITPGQWPIAIGADGVVVETEAGPTYSGTYALTQVMPASTVEGEGRGDATGWRSEGSFALTRDKLVVDKAVLSEGPPDRPSSLAGSMTLTLGQASRFFAIVQARQLDLDRSLGEGPKKPIEMSTAADEFVKWLRGIPVPGIAGTVRFNVPAIVVGGSVIQDVTFTASPADHGWQIEGFSARLPGQATLTADGQLSTGEAVGFGGKFRLAVNQPATFAAWWRGKGEVGTGRLLAPFELAGNATVTMDSLNVTEVTASIGDATLEGGFQWVSKPDGRTLQTRIEADRVDFTQVRALAELLGGGNLRDTSLVADNFQIELAAGQLRVDDLVMHGVNVNAGFADGGLDVKSIEIADIGGAQFTVARSRIDDILGAPLGTLDARLTAPQVTDLTRIVENLAPDTPFAAWFRRAAPYLGKVQVTVNVNSSVADGKPSTKIKLGVDADATDFNTTIDLAGTPAAWRQADVSIVADVKSYDATGLARQILLADRGVTLDGGARFDLKATGVPETGLATEFEGNLGGLDLRAEGNLALPAAGVPTFAGTFGVDAPDIAPFIALLGLEVPGIGPGMPVTLGGQATTSGLSADLAWQNGLVAGRQVSGGMTLAEDARGGVRLAGDVAVDLVDLGWISSLALGATPLPTGDPEEPWAQAPFGEPALRSLSAEFDIAAERLTAGDLLVRNGELKLALAPDRIDLDVKSGDALGGTVAGGVSVRNVGGNASLSGNLSLVGGALDSIIWQRAGRAVATGTLDLSTNFEATGRSPAGLVASLTGGGTLAIHDGEVRYLNPKAGVLVIRDSDLGQEFTEDALRDLLGSYIDNGSLSFGQVEAPFSIAAGTVRFQNVTLDATETKASGSAAIDLNDLELDSDWTLTLDPGTDPFAGDIPPQVGIVFRGPLDGPERILDVLQFNSYLAIRAEARLQEILALEEQARLENAFFNRVKRKIREDEEREARRVEAARQARIAYATSVEALHATRESAAAQRAEDELIAWWQVAEKAAADKEAAQAEAESASEAARAARATADAATARVADLTAAVTAAGEAVTTARAASDAAATAQAAAEANLAKAIAARDDAAARNDAAIGAVTAAETALAAATDHRGDAATLAQASLVKAEAAADQAATADAALAAASAAADAANRDAGERNRILAELSAELAAAETALAAATAEASAKAQVADALGSGADDAEAKADAVRPAAADDARTADEMEAQRIQAQDALGLAETVLLAARTAHEAAKTDHDAARTALDEDAKARTDAERYAAVARARATEAQSSADPASPDPAIAALLAAADAAEVEAAKRADIADRAGHALDEARTALQQKAAALTAAESGRTDALARLADATANANAARTAADAAAAALRAAELEASATTTAAANALRAANDAAAIVVERTATRDALAARVDSARAEVDAATAAATAATDALATANQAAADAQSVAELARRDSDGASRDLAAATSAINTASAMLDSARAAAETAMKAFEDATSAVAAGETARDAAIARTDAAADAVTKALADAEQALADLAAAQAAADTATAEATAAEATARAAAARAAALPPGWRPVERRADAGETPVAVVEAPAIAPDPEPAFDWVPVMPRLRPDRRPARPAASAADIGSDMGLPSPDRPLAISQP